MNEAERERLIKKDIASIENKVRHAFNQGYEMGMKDREKLNCTDCIIEKSDDFIKSHTAMMMAKDALSCSEKPNKWISAEVLDKIRAEIETDLSHFCFDEWGNENPTWEEIKAIIDKYKAESEDKE